MLSRNGSAWSTQKRSGSKSGCVILGQQVQPAAGPQHAPDLVEHLVEMRHGLRHVAAHDQIERRVRELQRERVADVEPHTIAIRVAIPARQHEVAFEDVDAHDVRIAVQVGKPARDLAGAAAQVQDAQRPGQPVACEQRLLLRPDRLRLPGQVARHRLIAHLPGLRIAFGGH